MNKKLLLSLLSLSVLCTFAQGPLTPQRLEPRKASQSLVQRQAYVQPFGLDETGKVNRANKARADQPSYNVDFVLDFDTETEKAYRIYLNNNDDGNVYWNASFGVRNLVKGSNVLPVPAGNYDLIVWFYSPEPITGGYQMKNMYVIREQMDINQDMELHFAADEAKNHIHFQTLMKDGTPINWGQFSQDENGNWTQTEECNVDDAYFVNNIINKDFGVVMSMTTHSWGGYNVWYNDEEGRQGPQAAANYFETASDFFVNDVSDRYAFHHYVAFIKDDVVYTSALEADGASSDVVVTTDPEKYVLFEDPFQIPNNNEELYRNFYIYSLQEGVGANSATISGQICNFWFDSPLATGETFKCYLNASVDDSKVKFVPYFQPAVRRKVIVTDEYGEYWQWDKAMSCKPLTMSNGEIVFVNNGQGADQVAGGINFSTELGESNSYGTICDYKDYPFFSPSHPIFTYSTDKKKENLGNNCPVMVSDTYQYEVPGVFRSWDFYFRYSGRYGERNVIDDSEARVNVKLNGEEIVITQGNFFVHLDQLINGVVDATITNELVQVDELPGSNMAQLHYTAGAEDENPPTITMLHFKDNNGDVTDRFAIGNEGMMEFSAGDFNFTRTPMGFDAHDRYAPETVEVSYSPYGEDNWNELPIEEVPENYWPTMGWFYTGSLASVTGEAYEGWFDLKIRLVDAAGNWQEQVLSPAFRIDNLAYSGIATPRGDKAREVARYNLAGQRVDSNATGVIIVKMSDGSAKKVIL